MTAFSKMIRVLILLLAAVPLTRAAATWTTIDVPGANATGVFRINNLGQMVGFYDDALNATHGFLLSGGTFTTIDFPGGTNSAASGINDSGQIVGSYHLGSPVRGFLLD